MEKVILKIWYGCNHNCAFCHAEYNKELEDDWTESIKSKIRYIKEALVNIEMILFSWWEPTIQKNFFELMEFAHSFWFKIWIVTNWSIIHNEVFFEKCRMFGLEQIYLSIHSWTEDSHNKITWSNNSFAQIKKLLNNIDPKEIKLLINCVVTSHNIDNLEDVVKFVRENWNHKMKFSLMEPKWLGYTDIFKLYVSPKIVAEKIKDLIQKYPDSEIFWDWLPLCLALWMDEKICNLQTEEIKYMSECFEDEIFETDYWVRNFEEICSSCKLKKSCYWNFKIYNEIYWNEILKPIIN